MVFRFKSLALWDVFFLCEEGVHCGTGPVEGIH